MDEKSRMKDRISKLKHRKGKATEDYMICGKCGKDFNEKENFNWSCRTHKSEWSGDMWWCCGKRTKEAYGCKYGKHEIKKDDDDDDDEDKEG